MDRDTVNGLIHLLNLLETCIAESAIYSTRTPVQNILLSLRKEVKPTSSCVLLLLPRF